MKTLLRLIFAILWLLLRIVIYLLTGQWVGGKKDEASPPASAPGAPRPVTKPASRPGPASRAALTDDERMRLLVWLDEQQTRLTQLREQARSVLGARSLELVIEHAILPELVQTRSRLVGGDRARSGLEHVAVLNGALDALAASIEARRDERMARMLADTEAMLASLYAPLYEHFEAADVPMKEPRVLALPRLDTAFAARLFRHTRLWLVRGFGEEPERLLFDARVHAQKLATELSGFVDELRSDYDLPSQLFAPPPSGGYDPDMARGALGVWLTELAADVLVTYALGPAFVRLLSASLSRPQAPFEPRVASLQGRFLSPEPPSLVRMYAATQALAALGFRDEGERAYAEFKAAHPAPEVLLLPRSDGSAFAVPSDYMFAELDPVLESLTTEPFEGLSDHSLLDVPGFGYQRGEHARATSAAEALLRGHAVSDAPRLVAAGALLALSQEPARRRDVVDALGRSVRGAGTLEAVTQAERPITRVYDSVPSVRDMVRDPAEIARALALGAAFERPRRFR